MDKKINKKIIEDLIKNNPDLDKKKLEEVILLLKQNNPNIILDKDFKLNLKSRLDAIREFKLETKKGFFRRLFLVPVFSVFLIAGGVFYIYSDINLLDSNDLQYKNIEILDEIQYIEEIEEERVNSKNEDSTVIQEETKPKNQNSPIIPFHKGDEEKERNIQIEEKIKIEDNQIIEILGEEVEGSDEVTNYNFEAETPTSVGSPEADTMFYDNGDNEPYINTFDEYCEEYNSEILGDDKKRFCIIEEKICMESDYSENTCKLIEKK